MSGTERPNGAQLPVDIFYADPVNEDGDVIGTATFAITSASGCEARAMKVPHSEIVLDPETTTRINMEDRP